MSAESRSLLPDWHQRPVRWKVQSDDAPRLLYDPDLRPATFTEIITNVNPPFQRPDNLSHRRSSCLTDYRPDTTAYLQGFVFGPDFNYSTVSKL